MLHSASRHGDSARRGCGRTRWGLEALRWVSVVAGFRGAGVLVGELLMMVMMEERDRGKESNYRHE
jgi:hypothetical protein